MYARSLRAQAGAARSAAPAARQHAARRGGRVAKPR
jgi:hypothetical protein